MLHLKAKSKDQSCVICPHHSGVYKSPSFYVLSSPSPSSSKPHEPGLELFCVITWSWDPSNMDHTLVLLSLWVFIWVQSGLVWSQAWICELFNVTVVGAGLSLDFIFSAGRAPRHKMQLRMTRAVLLSEALKGATVGGS